MIEKAGIMALISTPCKILQKEVQELFSNAVVDEDAVKTKVRNIEITITALSLNTILDLPIVEEEDAWSSEVCVGTLKRMNYSGNLHRSVLKKQFSEEFRLLVDIIDKTILCKTSSHDVVSYEHMRIMSAIVMESKLDWGRVLFQIMISKMNTTTIGRILSMYLIRLNPTLFSEEDGISIHGNKKITMNIFKNWKKNVGKLRSSGTAVVPTADVTGESSTIATAVSAPAGITSAPTAVSVPAVIISNPIVDTTDAVDITTSANDENLVDNDNITHTDVAPSTNENLQLTPTHLHSEETVVNPSSPPEPSSPICLEHLHTSTDLAADECLNLNDDIINVRNEATPPFTLTIAQIHNIADEVILKAANELIMVAANKVMTEVEDEDDILLNEYSEALLKDISEIVMDQRKTEITPSKEVEMHAVDDEQAEITIDVNDEKDEMNEDIAVVQEREKTSAYSDVSPSLDKSLFEEILNKHMNAAREEFVEAMLGQKFNINKKFEEYSGNMADFQKELRNAFQFQAVCTDNVQTHITNTVQQLINSSDSDKNTLCSVIDDTGRRIYDEVKKGESELMKFVKKEVADVRKEISAVRKEMKASNNRVGRFIEDSLKDVKLFLKNEIQNTFPPQYHSSEKQQAHEPSEAHIEKEQHYESLPQQDEPSTHLEPEKQIETIIPTTTTVIGESSRRGVEIAPINIPKEPFDCRYQHQYCELPVDTFDNYYVRDCGISPTSARIMKEIQNLSRNYSNKKKIEYPANELEKEQKAVNARNQYFALHKDKSGKVPKSFMKRYPPPNKYYVVPYAVFKRQEEKHKESIKEKEIVAAAILKSESVKIGNKEHMLIGKISNKDAAEFIEKTAYATGLVDKHVERIKQSISEEKKGLGFIGDKFNTGKFISASESAAQKIAEERTFTVDTDLEKEIVIQKLSKEIAENLSSESAEENSSSESFHWTTDEETEKEAAAKKAKGKEKRKKASIKESRYKSKSFKKRKKDSQ